jgi:hypothetical protein
MPNKISYGDLFSSMALVPDDNMSLTEQANTYIRLVLLLFLMILILDKTRVAVIFLSVSMVVIFLFVTVKRSRMNENFCNSGTIGSQNNGRQCGEIGISQAYGVSQANSVASPGLRISYSQDTSDLSRSGPLPDWGNEFSGNGKVRSNYSSEPDPIKVHQTLLNRSLDSSWFCNDGRDMDFNDPNYISPNKMLAGTGANPQTAIRPIVTAPSHDLSFWKANDLVTHSHLNRSSNQDLYLSGYEVSTCCGDVTGKELNDETYSLPLGKQDDRTLINWDTSQGYNDVEPTCEQKQNEKYRKKTNDIYELSGSCCGQEKPVVEGYTRRNSPRSFYPGSVNRGCGYNPAQVRESNLPANMAVGNCQKDPVFRDFNKNIFTQNVGQDSFTSSQVIEPINSNIGISFTQQFLPTTARRNEKSQLEYTEHDPALVSKDELFREVPYVPLSDPSSIFDPRFNGYGTSYRAYIDDNTGQPRFMYDDINAVRMPNYITRNKIDHVPFGDTYGPDTPNPTNAEVRSLANDSWLRNSLQFRDDMKMRLMRKRNNELWQTRMAPLR